jgi:ABC-2 type transport system permease protein
MISNHTSSVLQTSSLALVEYIDIGVFGVKEIEGEKQKVELYLQKHKITAIHNTVTLIINQKPTQVRVDSCSKLIDADSDNNKMFGDEVIFSVNRHKK